MKATERETHTHRESERERERETERETDRERDRETHRERERECDWIQWSITSDGHCYCIAYNRLRVCHTRTCM